MTTSCINHWIEGISRHVNAVRSRRLFALRLPLDQRALDDRLEAVRIATVQYKAGRRNLLWVAQLQTAALSNQSDLIKAQDAQRVNRVRLHQALGDSFDATPAVTASVTSPAKI